MKMHLIYKTLLQNYLRKYNYMGKGNPDPKIKKLEEENMELAVETGIRMFQRKWKLPVTG